MDELCLWESNKENIVSLPKGRDINVLITALTQPSLVQQQGRKFEVELRTYCGDDPMDVWSRYISWVRQTDISGKQAAKLVRKCVLENYRDAKLKNDARFVHICILYAQAAFEPIEMFDLLYNYGIGQNVAAFYKAYASLVADVGDLDKADGIYRKALEMGIESLKNKYEQFQRRVILLGEIAKKEGEERERLEEEARLDEEYNNNLFGTSLPTQRSTLAPLKPVGKLKKAPHMRIPEVVSSLIAGHQHTRLEKKCTQKTFKIYTEDSSKASSKVDNFFNEQQRQKRQQQLDHLNACDDLLHHSKQLEENKKTATKWTGIKLKQKLATTAASKRVEIFIEDVPNAVKTSTSRKVPLSSSVLKCHKVKPESKKGGGVQAGSLMGWDDECHSIFYPVSRAFVGIEEFSLEELMALDYYAGRRRSKCTEPEGNTNINKFKKNCNNDSINDKDNNNGGSDEDGIKNNENDCEWESKFSKCLLHNDISTTATSTTSTTTTTTFITIAKSTTNDSSTISLTCSNIVSTPTNINICDNNKMCLTKIVNQEEEYIKSNCRYIEDNNETKNKEHSDNINSGGFIVEEEVLGYDVESEGSCSGRIKEVGEGDGDVVEKRSNKFTVFVAESTSQDVKIKVARNKRTLKELKKDSVDDIVGINAKEDGEEDEVKDDEEDLLARMEELNFMETLTVEINNSSSKS